VVDQIILEKGLPSESRARLCDKTRLIIQNFKDSGRLPYINFRVGKAIRDILVHPGIKKPFHDGPEMDQTSVFEQLTVSTLKEMSGMISRWLDAACGASDVVRLTDTAAMVKYFSAAVGPGSGIKEV
jgi:hypothetical protein